MVHLWSVSLLITRLNDNVSETLNVIFNFLIIYISQIKQTYSNPTAILSNNGKSYMACFFIILFAFYRKTYLIIKIIMGHQTVIRLTPIL